MDDPLVSDDARALVADLTVRGQTVATAESLTAGLLAATLAGVPGASAVLRGGLVTYVEDTKILLAGVTREVLDEVAARMGFVVGKLGGAPDGSRVS
ncbi:CinA family protein, partial [Mycolicibacterium novocastrense]|uniref:CinA family protein n=1 Tax=Mycolicibacterium novocastrense TaxID=59813 RepID=UPI000A94230F